MSIYLHQDKWHSSNDILNHLAHHTTPTVENFLLYGFNKWLACFVVHMCLLVTNPVIIFAAKLLRYGSSSPIWGYWMGSHCLHESAIVALIAYMRLLPSTLLHGRHPGVYESSGFVPPVSHDHPHHSSPTHSTILSTDVLSHSLRVTFALYEHHYPFAPTDISTFPLTIDHGLLR